MGAISCLVPNLQGEMQRGCGLQRFEKTQCSYVAMCLNILLCYIKLTRGLVERQLESRRRQWRKTAAVKAGAYIVSIDGKTTVHRLEAGEIVF